MRNYRMWRRGTPRPSSYATLPVTGSILADWDASYGVTVSTGASDWADRTGSYVVSQATGTNQPSVSTINGRTALLFDGSNDTMAGAAGLAAAIDQSAPYTIYVVGQMTDTLSYYTMFSASNSVSSYVYHLMNNTGGTDLCNRGEPGSTSSAGTQSFGTNAFDYCAVYSGSAYSSWVNGVQSINASANARAPVCNTCNIGALNFGGSPIQLLKGKIGRMAIFGAAHSASERTVMSAFLRRQFGI